MVIEDYLDYFFGVEGISSFVEAHISEIRAARALDPFVGLVSIVSSMGCRESKENRNRLSCFRTTEQIREPIAPFLANTKYMDHDLDDNVSRLKCSSLLREGASIFSTVYSLATMIRIYVLALSLSISYSSFFKRSHCSYHPTVYLVS